MHIVPVTRRLFALVASSGKLVHVGTFAQCHDRKHAA